MRKYLVPGIACVALVAGGYYFYSRPFSPPPAPPRDLTKVLPKRLLDKAGPAQLAVLRGDAATAPLGSAANTTAVATADAHPGIDSRVAPANTITVPGLSVTFTRDGLGRLRGTAVNSTDKSITCTYSAGTLFSNGIGDVILLKHVSADVPAQYHSELELPVAVTSSENGALDGSFTPHKGTVDSLQGLLRVLDGKSRFSVGAAQTAVLALTEDVPLDAVSVFPRARPLALVGTGDFPFRVSSDELLEGLSLLRESGVKIENLAMMSDPQLKVFTMLDPHSHAAAMRMFGINDQNDWPFWHDQLLHGDPSLRHFALYGIARYYPDVALSMLPTWVRANGLYRNYRLSAAWALALIEDPRAQKTLLDLQREFKDDPGLKQAIDRALRHWNGGTGNIKTASVVSR